MGPRKGSGAWLKSGQAKDLCQVPKPLGTLVGPWTELTMQALLTGPSHSQQWEEDNKQVMIEYNEYQRNTNRKLERRIRRGNFGKCIIGGTLRRLWVAEREVKGRSGGCGVQGRSADAGPAHCGFRSVGKPAWLQCREDAQHQGQERVEVQSMQRSLVLFHVERWANERCLLNQAGIGPGLHF